MSTAGKYVEQGILVDCGSISKKGCLEDVYVLVELGIGVMLHGLEVGLQKLSTNLVSVGNLVGSWEVPRRIYHVFKKMIFGGVERKTQAVYEPGDAGCHSLLCCWIGNIEGELELKGTASPHATEE